MNDENQNHESQPASGVIHDLGVLDLRYAKSPDELKKIKAIHDVGVVIISEAAASALTEIAMNDVGSIVTIPSGVPVNCMTGQIKISGEALESGDPETILVMVGQTFITSPVASVGFKEIRIIGQLIAPRESQAVISSHVAQITGQVLYVPANCRLVLGKEAYDREFLELLPRPCPIMVMGSLKFEDDVTKELIQEKVTEIVLMGNINAPQSLVALLNVLTEEKMGSIVGR